MKRKYTMVPDVLDWQQMEGIDEFEKKVNSYLTFMFIGRLDLPHDECSSYARKFSRSAKLKKLNEGYIRQTLEDAFCCQGYDFARKTVEHATHGVMALYYMYKVTYDKTRSKSTNT